MEYNLLGIRNQVINDKLDDPMFEPDVVDRFINTAQRWIFNQFELPFTEGRFSGVIAANQTVFEFPKDVQVPQSLVITTADEQKDISDNYVLFRQFFQSFPKPEVNEAGAPTYWTSHAGKLYLSQPTDKAYQLDTFYIKKPTLLVDDTDIPEVPEEFQELLVLGAYSRVLKRNEDWDMAAIVDTEIDNEISMLNNRYGFRIQHGAVKMKNRQVPIRRR